MHYLISLYKLRVLFIGNDHFGGSVCTLGIKNPLFNFEIKKSFNNKSSIVRYVLKKPSFETEISTPTPPPPKKLSLCIKGKIHKLELPFKRHNVERIKDGI